MRTWLLLLALPASWPLPAPAAEAHYETFAGGLNIVDVSARFEVGAERYRVAVDYRTVGAFNVLSRGQQRSVATGRFAGGAAVPERFASSGVLRGEQRVTEIDYNGNQPTVRRLLPPNDGEREEVPAARQADTVDTLSAAASLLRRVAQTGRCDGSAVTFDGRRLATLQARTAGTEVLERSGRSVFAGPAVRCDFTGRQTGGFMLDEDRDRLRRPQEGTAWFATVDGTVLPVRVAFRTRWFGDATMYLVAPPSPK